MKHLLLGSAAAFCLPGLALAQTDTAIDDIDDVIIVEATKTKIDAFDYPGLVSSLDMETLDLLRPADLDDLLRDIPGLDIAGGPRRTGQTLALRGQGRENTTLLLDGSRQNFTSAHDGVLFVDPALLVGVETVRGSSSALYGSGASGGVIAFQTASAQDLLDAGDTWGFNLGAGLSSVSEEVRTSASLYGQTGRFDGLVSVSQRSSSDIRLASGDDLPAEDELFSSLVKVGADLGDGLRGELSWQRYEGEATEPNNGQGLAVADPLNLLVDKDITSDNLALTVNLTPPSVSWLDLDVTVYRNTSTVDEAERSSDRFLSRELETTGVRADQRFEFDLGAYDAALTVGGEYYEDTQTGLDTAATDGIRGGAPNASSQYTAGYTQLELTGPAPFSLPGRITLVPGVRYDDFETSSDLDGDTSDSATSTRFAATYAPVESFNIFASWGEAFRAPSINELYMDGTHFSLPHPILGAPVFITNEFIANPDLLPEETETWELGFGVRRDGLFTSTDQLEWRTAYFETDATNLIDLTVAFAFNPTCFAPPFFTPCSAGTSFSRNVGNAELSGIESQLRYEQGPFSLDASYSHIDGEDSESGDPLGSLSPDRLFLDARWTLDAQRLVLGGRMEWAAEFDNTTSPDAERDGYAVFGAYARWQPLEQSGLTINAGVDNLFDEDYERVFAGVTEPGTNARLDVRWSRNF